MKNNKKDKKIKLFTPIIKKHWLAISFFILADILSAVLSLVTVVYLADAVEQVSIGGYDIAVRYFIYGLIAIVVQGIANGSSWIVYLNASSKIMAELNILVARQAFKLNSTTFTNHGSGVFVQRIIYDPIYIVDNAVGVVDHIATIISGLLVIVYIMFANISIGIIVFGVLVLGWIIQLFRTGAYRKNHKLVREKEDEISSLTTQIVKGERDIKSLNIEDKLNEISSSKYSEYQSTVKRRGVVDFLYSQSRNLLIEVSSILILILGIYFLEKALISLAIFMVIYSNRNSLYSFVFSMGIVWKNLSNIKTSSGRIRKLFDEEEFITEKFGTVDLANPKGEIEFRNVDYSYKDVVKDEGKDKKALKNKEVKFDQTKVFENLNFVIPANKTVAFVGRSGSGKSTILGLISKLYEVDGGEVLIDGVNINDLSKNSLRNTIALVNQFPYIFDMSIKENLLLVKKDATDEEIIQALKDASFYEFVSSLKDGINTKVGEGGIKLSGGQRQRLAIARALLKKSTILIFDESTSSLDNYAQNDIKNSIDELKGRGTIIIVAHRLSTIRDADIIYFLENGKIVAVDSFENLFKNNEKFKAMYLAEDIR